MKMMVKALNLVITGLLMLVIAGSAVLAFSARRSPDKIPTVMGHKVLAVISGSMEPTISTGDVIIIESVKNPAQEIKDGDVITYRSGERADMLITHRVMGTVLVNDKPKAFVTKGDANPSQDISTVSPDRVIGRYQWRVPYFGYVSNFLRTPFGIVLVVIVPGLVLIGLEIKKMWQLIAEAEAAKAKGGDSMPQ